MGLDHLDVANFANYSRTMAQNKRRLFYPSSVKTLGT